MSITRTSRRKFIKTAALALPFVVAGCGSAQTNVVRHRKSVDDFVTIRNGRFELRDRPYFYIGANLWYGCYLCDPALPGGQRTLDS